MTLAFEILFSSSITFVLSNIITKCVIIKRLIVSLNETCQKLLIGMLFSPMTIPCLVNLTHVLDVLASPLLVTASRKPVLLLPTAYK